MTPELGDLVKFFALVKGHQLVSLGDIGADRLPLLSTSSTSTSSPVTLRAAVSQSTTFSWTYFVQFVVGREETGTL